MSSICIDSVYRKCTIVSDELNSLSAKCYIGDVDAARGLIDSNANVAYPVGTPITFVNQNGAGVVTISITSDTIRLAGAGTTGTVGRIRFWLRERKRLDSKSLSNAMRGCRIGLSSQSVTGVRSEGSAKACRR